MKLIVDEPESEALNDALAAWSVFVSSALLEVEAVRTCRQLGDEVAADADARLADVSLIPLDSEVLSLARRLDPRELRSLDAIHVATALSIRADVGAVFSYDERLTRAATSANLRVLAPRLDY